MTLATHALPILLRALPAALDRSWAARASASIRQARPSAADRRHLVTVQD